MFGKDSKRETFIYIIIAIFVIIVIIFAVFFSKNELELAYIHHDFLGEIWYENIEERDNDSQFFGLEKFGSLTYKIDGDWPASLTITTIKTLVMLKESELMDKTVKAIEQTLEEGIVINKDTEVSGERVLNNYHNTKYIIYDGNDTSKIPYEKIKIIGEVWNCGTSGNSVICIGIVQFTNNLHNDSKVNLDYWKKIVRDEVGTFGIGDFRFRGGDGLIYNVVCH